MTLTNQYAPNVGFWGPKEKGAFTLKVTEKSLDALRKAKIGSVFHLTDVKNHKPHLPFMRMAILEPSKTEIEKKQTYGTRYLPFWTARSGNGYSGFVGPDELNFIHSLKVGDKLYLSPTEKTGEKDMVFKVTDTLPEEHTETENIGL